MARRTSSKALFDEYAEAQALDPRRARAIAELILRTRRTSRPAAGMRRRRRRARRRRLPSSTPGCATSRTCASATACMCSACALARRAALEIARFDGRAPRAPFDAARHRRPRCSEREAACGAAECAACSPRSTGASCRRAGRRARARPARRSADRPQSLRHRSALRRRPATPGRSAGAPPRRCSRATSQDHGEWPKRIVLDLWGSARCAPAAMISRRPSR